MAAGTLNWGSITATAISGTVQKSTIVSTANANLASTGYVGAVFTIGCNFAAGPTDHCDWFLYGYNGTTKDTTPFASGRLSNATDPNVISVPVLNRPYVAVHMQMTGGTDSGVTDVTYRPYSWTIA